MVAPPAGVLSITVIRIFTSVSGWVPVRGKKVLPKTDPTFRESIKGKLTDSLVSLQYFIIWEKMCKAASREYLFRLGANGIIVPIGRDSQVHCFLQGAPKIGKSTLLRSALLPYERFVCGIMVQRLLKKGRLCGYRACVVNGLLPTIERKYQEGLEGIFLYNKIPLPGILEKVINRAAPLYKRKIHYILLDEIGGVEKHQPIYGAAVGNTGAGKPVFGVLKSNKTSPDH